ncbi:UDP-N-acetylglucosamine transferase subunit [Agyrium rufum]|nr:UDP-N-acetylglucosamine transferase subunit [Agyrium rufum]
MGILIYSVYALVMITLIVLRGISILPRYNQLLSPPLFSTPSSTSATKHPSKAIRILIVLGSGGHTAEMLSMLNHPAFQTTHYSHRSYIVSSGDDFSAIKAREFEESLRAKATKATKATSNENDEKSAADHHRDQTYGSFDIHEVPRARKIHQPLLLTSFSCLRCLVACIRYLCSTPSPSPSSSNKSSPSLRTTLPALILTNGPATGLIVLLASLILRFVGYPGSRRGLRSVYVESWARVSKMSLSGQIVAKVGLVDRLLVQWEGLGKWGEWRGQLVR